MQVAQQKVMANAVRCAMQRDHGRIAGRCVADGEPRAAGVDDHAVRRTLAGEDGVAQLQLNGAQRFA